MGRIRKLPFLSGSMAAVLTGIISFAAGADSKTIYIRMAVMMLIFFSLGVYVKNTIYTIKDQIEIKIKEKEYEEEQRLKKLKEEKAAEAQAAKKNAQNTSNVEHKIDMTAGDMNLDGFEPLDFVQALKSKVKEE